MKNNLIEHRKKLDYLSKWKDSNFRPRVSNTRALPTALHLDKKHRPKSVLKFKIFKKAISFSLTNIVIYFE